MLRHHAYGSKSGRTGLASRIARTCLPPSSSSPSNPSTAFPAFARRRLPSSLPRIRSFFHPSHIYPTHPTPLPHPSHPPPSKRRPMSDSCASRSPPTTAQCSVVARRHVPRRLHLEHPPRTVRAHRLRAAMQAHPRGRITRGGRAGRHIDRAGQTAVWARAAGAPSTANHPHRIGALGRTRSLEDGAGNGQDWRPLLSACLSCVVVVRG